MDRVLDRNNIESIKVTMQMHENIFKHQVRELHRVYSVQKMLMVELKNEIRQQNFWNDTDASHPLSIERQYHTTQRDFDLEKPPEAGPSYHTAFQSCKTSFGSGFNEEMEVDLTLSIGGTRVMNSQLEPNEKNKELNSCASTKSDRVGECSDIITTPISNSTVTITRERNGPHLLSQGLQLK